MKFIDSLLFVNADPSASENIYPSMLYYNVVDILWGYQN